MQHNNKFLSKKASSFPKQEESTSQKTPATSLSQKKLRKIWSLNLLKALSSGMPTEPQPTITTEPSKEE